MSSVPDLKIILPMIRKGDVINDLNYLFSDNKDYKERAKSNIQATVSNITSIANLARGLEKGEFHAYNDPGNREILDNTADELAEIIFDQYKVETNKGKKFEAVLLLLLAVADEAPEQIGRIFSYKVVHKIFELFLSLDKNAFRSGILELIKHSSLHSSEQKRISQAFLDFLQVNTEKNIFQLFNNKNVEACEVLYSLWKFSANSNVQKILQENKNQFATLATNAPQIRFYYLAIYGDEVKKGTLEDFLALFTSAPIKDLQLLEQIILREIVIQEVNDCKDTDELKKIQDAIANIPENLKKELEIKIKRKEEGLNAQTDQEQFNKLFEVSNFDEFVGQVREYCAVEGEFSKLEYFRLRTLIDRDILSTGRHKYKIFINEIGVNARIQTDKQFSKFFLINLDKKLELEQMFNYSANEYQAFLTICGGDEKFVSYAITDSHVLLAQDEDTTPPTSDNVNQRYNDIDQYNIIWSLLKEKDSKNFNEQFAKLKVKYQLLFIAHMVELLKQYSSARKKSYDLPACLNFSENQFKGNLADLLKSAFFPLLDLSKLQLGKSPVQINKAFEEMLPGGAIDEDLRKNIPLVFGVDVTNLTDDRRQNVLPELYYLDHLWAKLKKNSGGSAPREFERFEKFKQDLILMYEAIKKKARFGDKFTFLEFLQCLFDGDRGDLKIIITAEKQENKTTNKQEDVLKVEIVGSNVDNFKTLIRHVPFLSGKKTSFILSPSSLVDDSDYSTFLDISKSFATFKSLTTGSPATTTTTAAEHGEGEVEEITEATIGDTEEEGGDKGDDEHLPTAEETLSTQYKLGKISWGEVKVVKLWSENSIGFIYNPIGFDVTIGGQTFKFEGDEADVFTLFFLELMKHDDVVSLYIDQLKSVSFPLDLSMLTDKEIVLSGLQGNQKENIKKFIAANRKIRLPENPPNWLIDLMGAITDKKNIIVVISSSDEKNLEDYLKRFNKVGGETVLLEEGTLAETPNPLDQMKALPGFETAMKFLFGGTFDLSKLLLEVDDDDLSWADPKYKFTYEGKEYELNSDANWYYISNTHNGIDRTVVVRKQANTNAPSFFCRIDSVDIDEFTGEETFEFNDGVRMQVKENSGDLSTIGQPGLKLKLNKDGDSLSINPVSDPPFVKVVTSYDVEYLNYGRILIDQNNKADFRREGKNHLMSFIHPAFNKDKRNDEINNYINKIEDAQKKLEWLREQISELDNYIYNEGRLFYKDIDICTCTEEKLAEIKKDVADAVEAKIAELQEQLTGAAKVETQTTSIIDIAKQKNNWTNLLNGKKIKFSENDNEKEVPLSDYISISEADQYKPGLKLSFGGGANRYITEAEATAIETALTTLLSESQNDINIQDITEISFLYGYSSQQSQFDISKHSIPNLSMFTGVKRFKAGVANFIDLGNVPLSNLEELDLLDIKEIYNPEKITEAAKVKNISVFSWPWFGTKADSTGYYSFPTLEQISVRVLSSIQIIDAKVEMLKLSAIFVMQNKDIYKEHELSGDQLQSEKFKGIPVIGQNYNEYNDLVNLPPSVDYFRLYLPDGTIQKFERKGTTLTNLYWQEVSPISTQEPEEEVIPEAVVVDSTDTTPLLLPAGTQLDIPLLEAGLVNYDDVRNAISQITIETDLTALLTQISKISGYETQQSFNISIIQKLLEIGVDPKDLAVHFKNHYVAGSEKTLKSPANEIFEGFSVKLGESEFGFAISQETKSVFIRDVFGDYKDTKNYVTYQLSPINNDTPIAEALATSFVDKLTSQYPNIADLLKPTEEGAQTKPEIFVSLNQYLIEKKSTPETLPSDELKIQTFTLYGELAQIQDKSTLSPAEQILWKKITQALDPNYVHPNDSGKLYRNWSDEEKIRVGGIVLGILGKMQNASIVEEDAKLACYSYDGKVYDAENNEQQPIELTDGWTFRGEERIYRIGAQIYIASTNSPISKSQGPFVAEKHGWTTLLKENESLSISEKSIAKMTAEGFTMLLPANAIADQITDLDQLTIQPKAEMATDLPRLSGINDLHLFLNGKDIIQATVENNDIKLAEIKPIDEVYKIEGKLYKLEGQELKPVQAIEVQTPESVEVNLTSDNSKLELSSFTPTIRQEKLVEQRGRLSSLIGGLNSFTDKKFEAKNYLSMLKADGDRNFDVVNGAFAQIKQAFFTQLLQVLNQDEIPRDDLTNLVRSQARDLANKLPNWGVNDDNYGTYDEPSYAKVLCEGFVAGVVAEVIGQITQKAKIEISEIIQKGLSNGTLSKETIGENIWDEFVTNGIDRNGVNIKPDEEDATDFNLLTSPIELSIGDKVYKSVQEFKDAPPGKRYMTYDSSEGKKLATFDTGTYDVTENKKVDGTDLYELEVVSGVPETEKKYFYMEGERLVEKTLE